MSTSPQFCLACMARGYQQPLIFISIRNWHCTFHGGIEVRR